MGSLRLEETGRIDIKHHKLERRVLHLPFGPDECPDRELTVFCKTVVKINLFRLSDISNYYELRRCTENFLPLVSFYIKETVSNAGFSCNDSFSIDQWTSKCSECWVLKKKSKAIFVLK